MSSLLARLGQLLAPRRKGPAREIASADEGPLPHAVAERLDYYLHPSERRRAEVWRRHDGFFSYVEEQLLDDEYAGPYWSPVRGSGLYACHEEALRDAKAEIPWIRDSLT